jgi:hypothetical protein
MVARLRELGQRCDQVPDDVVRAARAALASAFMRSTTQTGDPPMSISAPTVRSTQVQQPLTLVMPIKSPAHARQLRALIEGLAQLPRNPIEMKLDELRSVHFARFVLLEDDTRLAVITSYDGDFEDYVLDFTLHIGDIFDQLLSFVADVPENVVPVAMNPDNFVEYVRAHDLRCVGSFYSAYPELSVPTILASRSAAA